MTPEIKIKPNFKSICRVLAFLENASEDELIKLFAAMSQERIDAIMYILRPGI